MPQNETEANQQNSLASFRARTASGGGASLPLRFAIFFLFCLLFAELNIRIPIMGTKTCRRDPSLESLHRCRANSTGSCNRPKRVNSASMLEVPRAVYSSHL